jgi:hypothetical protein
MVYGTLINSNHFSSSVINCQADERDFILINSYALGNQTELMIQGLSLGNWLTIINTNNTYDPKIACYAGHEEDVIIETINYTINNNEATVIKYNITNYENNRLFYECKFTSDCVIIRDFYTGYLDADEYHEVYFNITCSEGNHNANIKTVFVDELVAYHTIEDNLLINAV